MEVRDKIIGVGGLERYASVGLLRSVAVLPEFQGRGYGGEICSRLEHRASADGVKRLYILTETATGFFEKRGFKPVDRSAAPEQIKSTQQFCRLCPSSASLMIRCL
jgi:amino-acid N-acetyltransferase